ncbi:hypothetical protein A3Q56_01158 [Intoshia linei]|uniref:FHA domain-containing protein n=1 Tax=Intoshia linei TaxID=1819745 RepID=A0A177B9U5_9BILA|nr:hypothetical protein A3Q56_01158 [Intoshia linei]
MTTYGTFIMINSNNNVTFDSPITKKIYTIGSDDSCDIKLNSDGISKIHCVCRMKPNGQFLLVNKSRFGITKVNKRHIPYDSSANIYAGDILNVGTYYFKYAADKSAIGGFLKPSMNVFKPGQRIPRIISSTPMVQSKKIKNDKLLNRTVNLSKRTLLSASNGLQSIPSSSDNIHCMMSPRKGKLSRNILDGISPKTFYSNMGKGSLDTPKNIEYYKSRVNSMCSKFIRTHKIVEEAKKSFQKSDKNNNFSVKNDDLMMNKKMEVGVKNNKKGVNPKSLNVNILCEIGNYDNTHESNHVKSEPNPSDFEDSIILNKIEHLSPNKHMSTPLKGDNSNVTQECNVSVIMKNDVNNQRRSYDLSDSVFNVTDMTDVTVDESLASVTLIKSNLNMVAPKLKEAMCNQDSKIFNPDNLICDVDNTTCNMDISMSDETKMDTDEMDSIRKSRRVHQKPKRFSFSIKSPKKRLKKSVNNVFQHSKSALKSQTLTKKRVDTPMKSNLMTNDAFIPIALVPLSSLKDGSFQNSFSDVYNLNNFYSPNVNNKIACNSFNVPSNKIKKSKKINKTVNSPDTVESIPEFNTGSKFMAVRSLYGKHIKPRVSTIKKMDSHIEYSELNTPNYPEPYEMVSPLLDESRQLEFHPFTSTPLIKKNPVEPIIISQQGTSNVSLSDCEFDYQNISQVPLIKLRKFYIKHARKIKMTNKIQGNKTVNVSGCSKLFDTPKKSVTFNLKKNTIRDAVAVTEPRRSKRMRKPTFKNVNMTSTEKKKNTLVISKKVVKKSKKKVNKVSKKAPVKIKKAKTQTEAKGILKNNVIVTILSDDEPKIKNRKPVKSKYNTKTGTKKKTVAIPIKSKSKKPTAKGSKKNVFDILDDTPKRSCL